MASIAEVTISKCPLGRPELAWNNVYHLYVDSLDDAVAYGSGLVVLEQGIHSTATGFIQMHVALVGFPGVFVTVPLALEGAFGVFGELMPLFLACRVDLLPTAGRPGRKFYHVNVSEEQQAGGRWTEAYLENVQDAWDSYLGADPRPPLSNKPHTAEYTAALAFADITQHQFKTTNRRHIPPA